MLLIAVVDDDPKDASLLKDCVEAYCRKNSLAAIVHTYRDGLEFIRGTEMHDIIFLDIQMGKLDGLETARLVRKISQESILIFVSIESIISPSSSYGSGSSKKQSNSMKISESVYLSLLFPDNVNSTVLSSIRFTDSIITSSEPTTFHCVFQFERIYCFSSSVSAVS